jgi:2-keto-4-pentenoate hydratase
MERTEPTGGALGHDDTPAAIAGRFVGARRTATALPAVPGTIPPTLAAAYRVQQAAIELWDDAIVGWKVGYIAAASREADGDDRLVGPIFRNQLQSVGDGETVDFPVFVDGFAAVEAELVFRIAHDAPAGRSAWTAADAAHFAADLHVGIETAGSPLATINELGPRVVVSDFGNNAGMLLGPAIADWRRRAPPVLSCIAHVDGHQVGVGKVETLAGGPLVALAFALSRCARNGHPLRAGDLVTTGALTGIHEIRPGQTARIDFAGLASLRCRAVAAGAAA